MTIDGIIRVFCEVDDFVLLMQKCLNPKLLGAHERQRLCQTGLSESEMMTISQQLFETLYDLNG